MPSTTGHLKHIFLSQPAKGSLQLNTDREATQPGKHPSEPVTKSSWEGEEGGRGEKRRSLSSSSPISSAIGYPCSPQSLGVEVRSGDYRLG